MECGDTVQPIAAAGSLFAQHPRLHADLRQYLQTLFELAADALGVYADLKRQLGAIDFTDQERLLLDVLDHPEVAHTLAEELELLIVDEFQDTSPIQLALFLKLAAFAKQAVWVGDVKQAIYGFRGSDSALMKAVVDALPALGGTKDVLPTSWRSRPALVSFVNQVFGSVFAGLDPKDVRLTPNRKEIPDTVAVMDWMLEGKNKADLSQAIASGVARLMQQGLQVSDPRMGNELRPMRLADTAILARTNATVTEIAATLRSRGIPSATDQPGLLAQPEIVLALACLRRLNDDNDTLATAEILSLADCQEPEAWVADRLAWLASLEQDGLWKEDAREGSPAHPILATLKGLRAQTPLLSPREAVELVLVRCGLAQRAIQWQRDGEQARQRVANLDQLVKFAAQYEDECTASREAATLSGFLLWTKSLAADGEDALPQPGIDAVQAMTHHAAKGLEWPVVILCDLASDVRTKLWDVQAESRSGFDVKRPLHDRFLRYWPSPFGAQKNVAIAGQIAQSAFGQAVLADALEEHKRLLYVSTTRARDVLVFARPQKSPDGEWMGTVALADHLSASDAAAMTLDDGVVAPFERVVLTAASADLAAPAPAGDFAWYVQPQAVTPKVPLTVSASAAGGVQARITEAVTLGSRIDTEAVDDRSALGEAIHACIAADLVAVGEGISGDELESILRQMGVDQALDAGALHRQVRAVRQWIQARWPDARPMVESPLMQVLGNGQRVVGRTDLLLRTTTGWVLLDHKSTPQGSGQWAQVANDQAAQLAAYAEGVGAASGIQVEDTWLVLPVAGAALRVELFGGISKFR